MSQVKYKKFEVVFTSDWRINNCINVSGSSGSRMYCYRRTIDNCITMTMWTF